MPLEASSEMDGETHPFKSTHPEAPEASPFRVSRGAGELPPTSWGMGQAGLGMGGRSEWRRSDVFVLGMSLRLMWTC